MSLASRAKRWLLGSALPNEYLCLRADAITDGLRAELLAGDVRIDVTGQNFLLGYKPLLIGVAASGDHAACTDRTQATLNFVTGSGRAVASLELLLIRQARFGDDILLVFEGRHGQHEFLSRAHRAINRAYEAVRIGPAGNVGLGGNLYEQVRIGYAQPRLIAVISLGLNGRFNLFPTDLHGPFGDRHYAGSLRIGGKASDQVQRLRQLTLSTVEAGSFRGTYRLGKNHMRDLADGDAFELAPFRSTRFDLPLPKYVLGYRELQWIDCFDAGIHRIHFYEIVYRQFHPQEAAALAHVHRFYAQWRADRGLSAPWLLR